MAPRRPYPATPCPEISRPPDSPAPDEICGLTQLVGRILRQPYAKKTGMRELDESYVYCFQQKGQALLQEIRQGFKGEGLGDLYAHIGLDDEEGGRADEERSCLIRDEFKDVARQVLLPLFVTRDGAEWRKVSYEMDIASRIPWDQADLEPLHGLALSPVEEKDIEQVAAISEDVTQVIAVKERTSLRTGILRLDPVFVARHLMDIVPNPWLAHEFGSRILSKLLEKNEEQAVINNFVFIIEELRKQLLREQDRLAEAVFRQLIADGELRFLVIANDLHWKLPQKWERKFNELFA